uniref:cytochrome b n=1 Tax=Musculium lacustre TaxID=98299 RepID=UPI00223795D3|nr:cytochrome b [Musculium lacustre]UYR45703.1 cytochrome b [Musculium lacustre]UYR45716.1 cytochrome b [Musculium lacustre]
MQYSVRGGNQLIKALSSVVYDLPAPLNLSYFWNFGAILGSFLVMQILSGFLLVMHYTPDVGTAFSSVIMIMRDVNYGWLMRSAHANGASFFFFFLYMHTGRGIYYQSFFMFNTWNIGVSILLVSMAIAFLGYVLPWGQMSYWGATVITNLFGSIPYIGKMLLEWLWGGFTVNDSTLKRFFALHFILPFVLFVLVAVHVVFLHETGSSNPLGLDTSGDLIPFHPYFVMKDILSLVIVIGVFLIICFEFPDLFGDPINFIPANSMSTPLHIQPEWYFLFAYAVLRSIPSKLGGVIMMFMSILILYAFSFYKINWVVGSAFNLFGQIFFWVFVGSFIMLTFVGAQLIEFPFVQMGVISGLIYGFYFVFAMTVHNFWWGLLYKELS